MKLSVQTSQTIHKNYNYKLKYFFSIIFQWKIFENFAEKNINFIYCPKAAFLQTVKAHYYEMQIYVYFTMPESDLR